MTFSSNLAENPDSKLCPGHLMHHRKSHTQPDCHQVTAINLRFRRVILLAVALLGPMTTNDAAAESLRCGTQLIREGDLGIQVREKCGDPISEELIVTRSGECDRTDLEKPDQVSPEFQVSFTAVLPFGRETAQQPGKCLAVELPFGSQGLRFHGSCAG